MKLFRKIGSFVLSIAMALGLSFGIAAPVFAADNPYAPTEFVEYEGVTFGRATAAYNVETARGAQVYEGMPLFDGNADHLQIYVDLLLSEMGTDGILSRAAGTAYGTVPGTDKKYQIPSVGGSADVGNDGGTQWPNQFALSQSWNTDLVKEAGYQYGKEIRSEAATGSIATGGAITAHCAQVDPHQNPLAGRYDEAYGEDAFMSGVFTDAWGDGMSGRSQSNQDLYYQAMAHVKHWATYQSEFFRMQGSYNVSARTFYEYWAEAANRPAQNGSILGLMSSYGRINYVPSHVAFTQKYIQSVAPNGMATGCDFMAEYPYTASAGWMTGGAWSNGYDVFYSSSMYDRDALMVLAGHKQGGNAMAASFMGPAGAHLVYDHKAVLQKDIEAGVLGLTIEDVTKTIRPGLIEAVRAGLCDERDANGQPKYYPFIVEEAHAAKDYTKHYHNDKEIQDVALQAGEESIVLLKNNNNVLPLDSEKGIDLYGTFAQVYQYGLYSAALNQDVESGYATYSQQYPGGKTLLEALDAGGYDYVCASGRDAVNIKIGGKYVAANAAGEVYLTDDNTSNDTIWEIEDWGQDAYSFYSPVSGKWLDANIGNPSNAVQSSILGKTLTATYDANFKPISWGQIIDSDFPDFFEITKIGDKQYVKAGSKWNVTDFGANYTVPGYMGWYIKSNGETLELDFDGEIPEGGSTTSTAPQREAAGMGAEYELEITSLNMKEQITNDTAVIVVGAPYNGIAGEGVDRLYLDLGDGMVQQAQEIAKTYKDAGKNTVLIIKADFPVVADQFQNDENIDSILFMPMGGQYEAYAMTEVLYGKVNPSGKLTSTWYPSQDVLPAITEYSMPINATTSTNGAAGNPMYGMGAQGPTRDEDIGHNNEVLFGAIAPFNFPTLNDLAVITDTSDSDLQSTGLTYAYYDGEVTYPFGYGLSYTTFEYGEITAPATAAADGTFKVTVPVTNTGKVDGAEAVELYICNPKSAYGSAAPLKKLIGFDKVEVKAGQTVNAEIEVDPADIALWDVNAGKYTVEPGAYTIAAAADSSLKNAKTAEITFEGESLATLKAAEDINVWAHSFDSKDLQYVEYSKGRTIEAAQADAVDDDIFAVNSKAAGAYAALYGVELDGLTELTATVASENDGNKIEFHQDAPDGALLATVEFGKTEAVTAARPLTSTDPADAKYAGEYSELGYTDVTVPITGEGTHNIYIVFQNADARLATIDLKGNEQVFDDVPPGEWFYEPVMTIYQTTNAKGTPIMSGYAYKEGEPRLFGPADPLVRAQFAVMMYRLADEPDTTFDAAAFPDVAEGEFYSLACCWAKNAGVITGYNDGTFGVNDPINREQVATILYRYATQTLKLDVSEASAKGDLSQFSDAASVSEYAVDALKWANGAGIVTGNADGTIAPQGNALRAHCAAMFTRFINYVATLQ